MNPITDNEVSSKISKNDKIIIIDCFGHWCQPCKRLAPTLDALSIENESSTEFYKLDIDTNPQTLSEYSVRSVPTLLFFKNGKLINTLIGNHPKEKIQEIIDNLK